MFKSYTLYTLFSVVGKNRKIAILKIVSSDFSYFNGSMNFKTFLLRLICRINKKEHRWNIPKTKLMLIIRKIISVSYTFAFFIQETCIRVLSFRFFAFVHFTLFFVNFIISFYHLFYDSTSRCETKRTAL